MPIPKMVEWKVDGAVPISAASCSRVFAALIGARSFSSGATPRASTAASFM